MNKTPADDKNGQSNDDKYKNRHASLPPEMEDALDKVDKEMMLSRKANRGRRFISNLMILAGIALIVVPIALTWINARRNNDAVDAFLAEAEVAVGNTSDLVNEDVDSYYVEEVNFGEELGVSPSPAPVESTIPEASPMPEASPTATDAPAPTKTPLMSKEEIQKRMIGVLIIDKIEVKLPVLTGVDDETLRVAAGRMPNSGKFNEIGNVVLAGHRSYTFGKYFNRLDEMEDGDLITVKTKTKTLTYKVFKKWIVEPDDFSIMNYNNKDKILTLFTCHPVAVASHRLVVQAIQLEE